MVRSELEQKLRQEPQPRITRIIALRGVGLDPETGVCKFAGEAGGPPGSVELSGERLETFERSEAELMNELYDFFLEAGRSEAESRRLAGTNNVVVDPQTREVNPSRAK